MKKSNVPCVLREKSFTRIELLMYNGHVSTMPAGKMKASSMQIETTYSEQGVQKSL